jgi:hypothetical protein
MTFDADETSIQDGQPKELYLWQLGDTRILLTNATTAEVDGLDTYLPSTITRDQPTYSIEKAGSEVTFEIALGDLNGAALVSAYISRLPEGLTQVAVKKRHPTGDEDFWSGFVVSAVYTDDKLKVLARPLSNLLSKTAPRRGYGKLCQHVFFDSRCTIQRAAHTEPGTVTSIDSTGLVFTVPGIATPEVTYLTGEIKKVGAFDRGMIVAQSGDTFSVRYPIPGIEVNDAVEIVAGCRHDTIDCTAYANVANASGTNIENYGGFPWTPDINLFEKGLDGQGQLGLCAMTQADWDEEIRISGILFPRSVVQADLFAEWQANC